MSARGENLSIVVVYLCFQCCCDRLCSLLYCRCCCYPCGSRSCVLCIEDETSNATVVVCINVCGKSGSGGG